MKFGFRTPSLKKRFAARTSLKRYVRHNLGFKAPRGYGWFTNPKKALYNRVYNRTTVDVFQLTSGRKRSTRGSGKASGSAAMSGGGLVKVVVGAVALVGSVLFGVLVAPLGLVFILARSLMRARSNRVAAEDATRALAEVQTTLERRRALLTSRFGVEAATKILSGEIWQGATEAMIVESLGPAERTDERVLKTKTKRILKYFRVGRGYALKVTIEDGVVVGWDDTREKHRLPD